MKNGHTALQASCMHLYFSQYEPHNITCAVKDKGNSVANGNKGLQNTQLEAHGLIDVSDFGEGHYECPDSCTVNPQKSSNNKIGKYDRKLGCLKEKANLCAASTVTP